MTFSTLLLQEELRILAPSFILITEMAEKRLPVVRSMQGSGRSHNPITEGTMVLIVNQCSVVSVSSGSP